MSCACFVCALVFAGIGGGATLGLVSAVLRDDASKPRTDRDLQIFVCSFVLVILAMGLVCAGLVHLHCRHMRRISPSSGRVVRIHVFSEDYF